MSHNSLHSLLYCNSIENMQGFLSHTVPGLLYEEKDIKRLLGHTGLAVISSIIQKLINLALGSWKMTFSNSYTTLY